MPAQLYNFSACRPKKRSHQLTVIDSEFKAPEFKSPFPDEAAFVYLKNAVAILTRETSSDKNKILGWMIEDCMQISNQNNK